MTTEITLDQLRAANPVPQPDRYEIQDDVLLRVMTERSVAMSTSTEHQAVDGVPDLTDPEPKNRRPGWVIALGAFAAVIVVGLVIGLLANRDADQLPPATTVPAPPTTQAAPAAPTEVSPEFLTGTWQLGSSIWSFTAEGAFSMSSSAGDDQGTYSAFSDSFALRYPATSERCPNQGFTFTVVGLETDRFRLIDEAGDCESIGRALAGKTFERIAAP